MLAFTRSALLFGLAAQVNQCIAGYVLEDDYNASSFFNMFSFFTASDPTNGFVQYVDQSSAQSDGLISTKNGQIYIGVDKTNIASNGRPSVRLTSNKEYNHGLIILDLEHMPEGCGTWPAFWMFGPGWPNSGEVDIIEGVNEQSTNSMTLHTAPGLTISDQGGFSGSIKSTDCNALINGNQGCSISAGSSLTYGSGFNGNNGGVYATLWTSQSISVYFFPRGSIPSDVSSEKPDPTTWGTPLAKFSPNSNLDSYIMNQNIIFDLTFCGDWAGAVWSSGSCASKADTCVDYVKNNPSAFDNAYWTVNSLRVYQDDGKGADLTTSSALPTATPTSVAAVITTTVQASELSTLTSGSATFGIPNKATSIEVVTSVVGTTSSANDAAAATSASATSSATSATVNANADDYVYDPYSPYDDVTASQSGDVSLSTSSSTTVAGTSASSSVNVQSTSESVASISSSVVESVSSTSKFVQPITVVSQKTTVTSKASQPKSSSLSASASERSSSSIESSSILSEHVATSTSASPSSSSSSITNESHTASIQAAATSIDVDAKSTKATSETTVSTTSANSSTESADPTSTSEVAGLSSTVASVSSSAASSSPTTSSAKHHKSKTGKHAGASNVPNAAALDPSNTPITTATALSDRPSATTTPANATDAAPASLTQIPTSVAGESTATAVESSPTYTFTILPDFPSPMQGGVPDTCTSFYMAVPGDTCNSISQSFGNFSTEQFMLWNLPINIECTNMWAWYYFCINGDGDDTSSTVSRRDTEEEESEVENKGFKRWLRRAEERMRVDSAPREVNYGEVEMRIRRRDPVNENVVVASPITDALDFPTEGSVVVEDTIEDEEEPEIVKVHKRVQGSKHDHNQAHAHLHAQKHKPTNAEEKLKQERLQKVRKSEEIKSKLERGKRTEESGKEEEKAKVHKRGFIESLVYGRGL